MGGSTGNLTRHLRNKHPFALNVPALTESANTIKKTSVVELDDIETPSVPNPPTAANEKQLDGLEHPSTAAGFEQNIAHKLVEDCRRSRI